MVDVLYPVDAVAGSPVYGGRMLRQVNAVAFGGSTAARPLGGRSGVRPGTSSATVTATSTTWTCGPLSGVADVETAAEAGLVTFALDAVATGAITAASASFARQDLIYVQIDIPVEDGSAVPVVTRKYIAGTVASTDPALPVSRAFAIARINVPISGGGVPTVTWLAPYAVAAGGVIPVRSSAEYPAVGARDVVYDISLRSVLIADSGAWNPIGGAMPGGRVKRSAAAASLTGGQWSGTAASTWWVTDQPASGATYSNGVWTCTLAGEYDIEAAVLLDGAVSMGMVIKKNDVAASSVNSIVLASTSGVNGFTGCIARRRVRLAAGDTLAVAIYVSATVAWNTSTPDLSFFGLRYVEPLR